MAQPFELRFVTNLADLLGDVKRFGEGVGQVAQAVGQISEVSKTTTDGLNSISEAASRNAETITAAATAQKAEATELQRLTELLGSEEAARASLNSRIIDTTATQVASEEQIAASLARREELMAAAAAAQAERTAAQQAAAAARVASAGEEVAATESLHQVEQITLSDAAQSSVLKAAAAEAARNLARQIEDLTQAQRNLAEIESQEPGNAALVARTRQEVASETLRVAEAERVASEAKRAQIEIDDRLAAAEKRAATAAKELAEAQKAGSFAGRTRELGELVGVLGLFSPQLFGAAYGLQMLGQATENFGPRIAAAGGGVTGFVATLGPFIALAAAATGVCVGLAAAVGLIATALAKAAPQQSSETMFALLLGDVDKARDRLEELDAVAARFRLDPAGVRSASEELTRFSQGALGSGKSLETVIEMSARSGKSLTEMGAVFGRLYETIQSGQPVGRMAQQLVRLGIVSASDINHLNNLHKEGAKGPQIWEEAQAAIGRYSGAAAARANTFEGATRGLKGAWDQLLETFGRPIVDALTPFLRGVGDILLEFRPVVQVAGLAIGSFLRLAAEGMQAVAAVMNGDFAGAASHITGLLTGAVPIVEASTRLIGNLVLAGFLAVQAAFDGLGAAIVSALAAMFDKSLELAAGFVKSMTSVLALLPGSVKQSVDGAIDSAVSKTKTLIDGTANFARERAQQDVNETVNTVLRVGQAMIDLDQATRRVQPGAPNTGTQFKPLSPGAIIEPDGKSKGGGRSAVAGRDEELKAARVAEQEYREQLEATKDSLQLGEITLGQAQAKNRDSITASIAKFRELQRGLDPTSHAYLYLEASIKKAQLALAQQSVFGQVRAKLIELRNEFADLGKQISTLVASQINGAIDGIANTLGQLAVGINNTKQAFLSYIEQSVSGLVKLAAQQLTSYILSKTIKQSQTADTLSNNAATQASNATTGLLESITSYGVAAAVGAAAFLAAMAIAGGFERGGYTGGREGQPAGVVHGEEFVFSAPATRHWGVGVLQTMSQMRLPVRGPNLASAASTASASGYSPTGRAGGPRGGRGGDAPPLHVHYHADENAMRRFIAGNQGRHIILSHVNGSAVDLGNPTT